MESMRNRGETEMEIVYGKTYNQLSSTGIKPTMDILNKNYPMLICTYLKNSNVNFQKVPPHCHRANAAER